MQLPVNVRENNALSIFERYAHYVWDVSRSQSLKFNCELRFRYPRHRKSGFLAVISWPAPLGSRLLQGMSSLLNEGHFTNKFKARGNGSFKAWLNVSRSTVWIRILCLTKHHAIKTYGGVEV
jgi:hypothetical protein